MVVNDNDKTIPKGWKKVKLGDVVITNQENIDDNYPYKEILYLDTGSITKGRIYQLQKLKIVDAPSRAKRLVKDGDIIFSSVRPIQRHYGFIKNPPENLVVSTGFVVLTVLSEKSDPRFIYYFLTSDEVVEVLDVIAEGSTSAYPSIRPFDIENLDIFLPPLEEQKVIASVLSSLDDKIDLLHRQNQTLEKIAETLFRKWFIEDAKNDWEEKFLKDIYIFEKGFEPGSSNYLEEQQVNTIRFIRVGDMLNSSGDVYIDKSLVLNTCQEDDLLVSFDGTVGRVIFGLEGAYSSGIRKIYSENPIYNNLGLKYLIFKSKDIQELINSHATGTVILHASSSIDYLSFNFPPEIYIKEFNKLISPIFDKILINKQQIRTLEQMRDALLPKLMNGEVRVKRRDFAFIKKEKNYGKN